MARKAKPRRSQALRPALEKCPTGISGLDEITHGGLPRGRPTLVCGNAGCGKTILAMEFLVRGARDFGEPGVFMSFEERDDELAQNVSSLGFDLANLVANNRIVVDHVHIERSEIEETGEYDLDGLFIRLSYAIDTIGAKRVVLDTVEALFSGFSNASILRAELRRLFRWLKDKGVTAIITGERGEQTLTRNGLEEYVADCVILLDLRVREQIATRRLRIVKYRGTTHGGDEYPFLIDEGGVSILPITSLSLEHAAPTERVSTGIERLDAMLGGEGYYRSSSILVSGTAGSGKSSVAARFAEAACARGERCLFFAYEESPAQIVRNMKSVGCDLETWHRKGLLRFHASRPSLYGLEMHLVTVHKVVNDFAPSIVVIDPITNISTVGGGYEAKSMLTRLMDFMKTRGITTLMTDLTRGGTVSEASSEEISSLVDTWLSLRDMEADGERNRGLHILKSRGMAHSNQVREFVLSRNGVSLVDVYLGAGGMLTGSARLAREQEDEARSLQLRQDLERKRAAHENKRVALEASISAMRVEFDAQTQALHQEVSEADQRVRTRSSNLEQMAQSRRADAGEDGNGRKRRSRGRPGGDS